MVMPGHMALARAHKAPRLLEELWWVFWCLLPIDAIEHARIITFINIIISLCMHHGIDANSKF